jgi:hypothetical protein
MNTEHLPSSIASCLSLAEKRSSQLKIFRTFPLRGAVTISMFFNSRASDQLSCRTNYPRPRDHAQSGPGLVLCDPKSRSAAISIVAASRVHKIIGNGRCVCRHLDTISTRRASAQTRWVPQIDWIANHICIPVPASRIARSAVMNLP